MFMILWLVCTDLVLGNVKSVTAESKAYGAIIYLFIAHLDKNINSGVNTSENQQ